MRQFGYGALFFVCLLAWAGCDDVRDREDYGDLTTTPGGIAIIDASEHQGGYGRGQCLVCHNSALNLHRRVGTILDADVLNQTARTNGEERYCMTCHGSNGT